MGGLVLVAPTAIALTTLIGGGSGGSSRERTVDWAAAAEVKTTKAPSGPGSTGVTKPSARLRVLTRATKPEGQLAKPAKPTAIPLLVPHPEKLKRAKAEAARAGAAEGTRAGSSARPNALGKNQPSPKASLFNGLIQPGLSAGDGTPPDTTGAIGPNHYVEFVNSQVGVYDRNLSPVSSANLDDFDGAPGENVFDVQIQWDPQADRWLYANDDIVDATHNYIAFGWSKTSDPSDLANGWCNFFIGTGSDFYDYPKLGHDNNHIIIGANVFSLSGSFVTAAILSAPKPANGDTSCTAGTASLFAGSPLTTADGTIAFTPVPANTADSSGNGYVVAADSPLIISSPDQIMAWHVSGPAASPTLTADGNIGVSAFGIPANVPQPGTTKVLDSLDGRLTQAVAHADPNAAGQEAVWTQHTVDGAGGRSVVRWYELLPAAGTARQEGTISDPAHFAFNGAISPTMSGSGAAIDYNVGSSSQAVQIRAQSRHGSLPLGTMSGEITLGTSDAADQDFSCVAPYGPPCRWGDYAGASPDPNNASVVWGSSQLNGPFTSDPHWITRNFALSTAPGPSFVHDSSSVDDSIPGGDGDGAVEPGDRFALTEQVRNVGDATGTGLSGHLSSSTPGLTIQQPDSPYPDIAAGASGANSTPFEASVSGTVGCGTDLNMALDVTSAQGATSTVPVTIPTGVGGGTASQDSSDVPKPIDDLSAATSTLDVGTPGTISDVNVRIADLRHTWDSDLTIEVVGPDGTTVMLSNRRGGSGDNFINTVFDDEATTPIASGSPPFTGSFRPDSPLSAFDGKSQQGTWTLRVEDHVPGDSGTLNGWGNTIQKAASCGAVDETPPETAITSGPSGPTNDATPEFGFSSDEPGSTFECRVDSGAFASCTSPYTVTPALTDGPHTFEVKATDQAGNEDATPASRSFTVDTVPPAAPSITAADPPGPANDNDPEVRGTVGAGSPTQVRLYTLGPDCLNPATASGTVAAFTGGGVTVHVADDSTTQISAKTVDAAGNESACSNSITYVEDSTPTAAPRITGTDPDSPANDNNPKVKGTVAEAPVGITQDGSFEAAGDSGNSPSWAESDSLFGTPLCTVAVCGSGGGTAGPHTGSVWVWFGGAESGAHTASVSQSIAIPSGAGATLSFYLRIGKVGNGDEAVSARIDGTQLFSASSTAGGYSSYSQVTRDASGFADGGMHTLTIAYSDPNTGAGFANVNVDDVSLGVQSPAPPTTEILLFENFGCAPAPAATGTLAEFSGAGITVNVPDDSTTQLSAAARDAAGNDSSCSDPFSYVESSTMPPGPQPPGPQPADHTGPALKLLDKSLKLKGSTVRVRVKCPQGEPAGCANGSVSIASAARVKLGAKKKILEVGRHGFALQGGQTRAVPVKASAKARRYLESHHSLRVKVTASARDQVRNTGTAVKTLVLKAK